MLQASSYVNLDVAGSAVGNKNILKLRFQNEDPNQKHSYFCWYDIPFLVWVSQTKSPQTNKPNNQNQPIKTTTVWITSATAEFADDLFNSFW